VRLRISEHTVKFHVNAIMGKLGARTRTEAVTRAARTGLITLQIDAGERRGVGCGRGDRHGGPRRGTG